MLAEIIQQGPWAAIHGSMVEQECVPQLGPEV